MRTTSTNTTDCRCKNCQALLAKHDRDGLSIRRGDMQTTVTGADFTVAVTCYRCKTLNVLASPRKPTPTPSTGAGSGTSATSPTSSSPSWPRPSPRWSSASTSPLFTAWPRRWCGAPSATSWTTASAGGPR